jgi:hemerythrin-like domain-containing protein
MKARGPLMIEHRLIEKMLEFVKQQVSLIDTQKSINPVIVDTVVDFIKTYADRTHHGKEEDILFRELSKKQMSAEDQKGMDELVEEHRYGRRLVQELVQARKRYVAGSNEALGVIRENLALLADFYPKHIEKEDKVFFPNTEKYFTTTELDSMLQEFWEFDKMMIHEKYKSVVEEFKNAQ